MIKKKQKGGEPAKTKTPSKRNMRILKRAIKKNKIKGTFNVGV